MERKPPRNDKYAHIQSSLDTGPTVNKVKFISNKECSKRRDEIFYRLTKTQMHTLLCEYEQDEREDIADVNSGYNGGPRIMSYSETSTPTYSKPYLIYDVREPEEYNEGHITQARSYSHTMMRRDKIHPELYQFRNKEACLIIVYCNDESISQEAATLLVQRGADNVYLLTGGIFEFAAEYSMFVEGVVPIPAALTTRRTGSRVSGSSPLTSRAMSESKSSGGLSARGPSPGSGSLSSARSGDLTAARLGALQAQISSRSGAGSGDGHREPVVSRVLTATGRMSTMSTSRRDDRSETAMTSASNMSVAETVISRAAARKGKF